MGLTGSGVGGNVGGPQVPLQRDLETTSWTEINKAALGITADTLERAFTQMNPRYTSGYYGGYKSSEGQPLLDHPLETGRMAQGFEAISDEAWKDEYDRFLRQLPDDLQKRFNEEGQKPFDERRGSYVALDNLLVLVAKLSIRTNALAQVEAAGPLETERTLSNQLLPFTTLRGVLEMGSHVSDSAAAYVQSQGPNNPFFDTFNRVLTEVGGGIKDFQQLTTELRQGGISQNIIGGVTQLADNLNAMNESLKRTNLGGNLKILNSTMQAMTTVASALSLFSTGSSSLFLGLSLSSIGAKTSDSETGVIGNALAKSISDISSGVISSLIPNASLANQRFLEMSLTTGATSLVGLASLAIEPGFGIFPNKDPTAVKSARFFAFELLLLLMNSSKAVEQVLVPFLKSSGADDTSAAKAAEILAQLGHLLMITTGTRDGRQNPAHLVENGSEYLERGVTTAGGVINSDAESIPGDIPNAASIALQQAQMALDGKDYEGFLDAFASLLDVLGTDLDHFTKDIDTVSNQTRTVVQAAASDSEPKTTVVRFV